MAESEFRVVYDGDALRDGRMAVEDLAPALLALGELFRDANTIINPNEPPVSLQIRATTEGSFDVDLVLVQHGIQHVVNFLTGDLHEALRNLEADILSAYGLFELIRRMRGRRVRGQEPQPDGTIVLILDDGDRIITLPGTADLARRPLIRRHARKVVEPLRKQGITILRFHPSRGEEPTVIASADVPSFDVDEDDRQTLLDATEQLNVTIASVAFTEGNKWRLSDGSSVFYAAIADEGFLQAVDRGEEAFRKGDILRCEMRVEQFRTVDGGLTTERTVTRVLQHIPATAPVALPFEGDDPDAG